MERNDEYDYKPLEIKYLDKNGKLDKRALIDGCNYESVKDMAMKESNGRKCTVKEIKTWMKTLEENRYKKLVNADCRRVAWFVNNNMSEDYESMPTTLRKKWSKASYGKERYLAKEFIKSKKQQMKEELQLKNIIKKYIKEELRSNNNG